MKSSESILNLAKAIVAFSGEIQKIAYDKKNPQFRSKYVTLDTLIEVTKPILQKNGLSVLQIPLSGDQDQIGVKSLLIHESGEFIESEPLFMTPQRMVKGGEYVAAKDAQAAGSTISYLRRYSYQAILNLSTGEDDDGESAVGRGNNSARENTTEPSTDRQSRRERTETVTETTESNNSASSTNEETSQQATDQAPRRSRRENVEETPKRGGRGNREGNEQTSEETNNGSEAEAPRRGRRRG